MHQVFSVPILDNKFALKIAYSDIYLIRVISYIKSLGLHIVLKHNAQVGFQEFESYKLEVNVSVLVSSYSGRRLL